MKHKSKSEKNKTKTRQPCLSPCCARLLWISSETSLQISQRQISGNKHRADGECTPFQIFVLDCLVLIDCIVYHIYNVKKKKKRCTNDGIHLGCRTNLPSGRQWENTCEHESCNPVARCLFCSDKLRALKDFITRTETFPVRAIEPRSLYSSFVNLRAYFTQQHQGRTTRRISPTLSAALTQQSWSKQSTVAVEEEHQGHGSKGEIRNSFPSNIFMNSRGKVPNPRIQ